MVEQPSRSRWPLGVLGMLALVLAIESGLSRHWLRFADTASLNWRLSADDLAREARDCEVACLGDSLVKIGVLPEVIRARTGRRSFNFAMARAPAPATYFMLRRLLGAGGRPSAIVLDFKPILLSGGPRLGIRHFQEILTPAECLDLARADANIKTWTPLLLGRALPSVRYRIELREAIRSALLGESAPTATTNQLAFRNWSHNLGAHLNPMASGFDGEVSEQIHQWLRSDDWKVNRVNDLYVSRILDLAESRSIPVYWVIPPMTPNLQARRAKSGVEAEYTKYVRTTQAKHPGVTVLDGRGAGYESSLFADHTHLSGRGSIALSHEIADLLNRQGGDRPRWVDLPKYRERPVDFPGEPLDQSRIALEKSATRQ